MHRPTSAALPTVRCFSAWTSAQMNAGSGAAAARLKCPVLRATSTGDQANATPARNASVRVALVAARASPYVISDVSTLITR